MVRKLDPHHAVWVASYPRSGNTFIRLLLANYFVARFEPISLHTIKDFNFGEHIEWLWHKTTGKTVIERDEQTEWHAREAYINLLRQTTPPFGYRFIKTHTVNCTRWGKPAFQFTPTDRIIYIARNPLDVVVSLAAFHGWNIEQAVSHVLEPFATLSGYPLVGHEVTGSWNLHVTSWIQETRAPVLVVPYYQLRADPAAWLTQILTFIGAPPSPQQVKNAVLWSGFEALQAQEAREGFPEAPRGESRQPFFRAGKVGQWRELLTGSQVERITNACAEGIKLVGLPQQAVTKEPCQE